MATTEFLPFATGDGADVLSPADYSTLPARTSGFGTGTAISTQLNTAWRQASVSSNVLAQFSADTTSSNVLDNGTPYLAQFKAGVRSQVLNYVPAAGGSANALTATLDPAPASYTSLIGMPLRVKITNTNTAAATLNLNGLGALPIYSPGGASLFPGALTANDTVELLCAGTSFVLVASTGVSATKIATLYVRTDGSDSNNGSANNSANAFATIGAAVAYGLSRYSLSGSDSLTIQLGNAGTYTAPGNIYGAAALLNIVGDVSNQSAYIISGAPPAGSGAQIASAGGSTVLIRGFTLQNTGTSVAGIGAVGNSSITHSNITFASTVATTKPHIFATQGGSITTQGGNIVSGFAGTLFTSQSGFITITGATTMSGAPDFSQAVAVATDGGAIIVNGGTFSGSATGKRYSASINGTINTSGAGSNFFPGNVAGDTATGGQYA